MKMIIALSVLVIVSCAPVAQVSSVDLCEKTVREYGTFRDEGPADKYADLFTGDGEFHLGGNVTKGRDALIARHRASNANSIWRHNMTDIRIRETDDNITGIARFHIFMAPKSDKPGAPAREIIGDYMDEFIVENGACKIKSRTVKIVFDQLN